MEVYLTRHARNRMRLYDISAEEIEEAAKSPEQITPGGYGHQHAWKRRSGGGMLRVTFKDERLRRVVITVTPKRQSPGGSHAD